MLVRRSPMMLSRQTRQRLPEALDTGGAQGLLDDKVLFLVYKASNWNPFMICTGAMVCKRFAAMTKKVIWKEFCLSRAPKMVTHLISGGKDGNIPGGWEPLGRLMFNCPGCHASKHFISKLIPGHFVWKSKFSRSLGKDFLPPQCSADTLYISGSCEHLNNGDDDDLGLYRGIFRAFGRSSTFRMLIENHVPMEEKERCPFCREKVWSMTGAKLVPPSAVRRLRAYRDNVEYFVCVNGHLQGMASLISASDSEFEFSGEE